jgi:PAS domain S-box-containing protein
MEKGAVAAMSPKDHGGQRRLPTSPFPMWIFETGSGAILAANEAAAEAYGYSRDELLTCRVHDLCPPHVASGGLLEMLRTREPWMGTFEQRRKDGSTFEVDLAMVEMGDGGGSAIMVIAYPALVHREDGAR